jgi:hypothetical protein
MSWPDRRLARWVADKRLKMRKGTIPARERQQLEKIGLGPRRQVALRSQLEWEKHFKALVAFRAWHGHCRVPTTGQSGLGSWIHTQRAQRRDGILRPERSARLTAIGFCFDVETEDWERGFHLLEEFHRLHGHADGPFRIHNQRLSHWTTKQRRYKALGKLGSERVRRLDALGFKWQGDRGTRPASDGPVRLLLEFKRRHGHFDIPNDPEHMSLFQWVEAHRALAGRGSLDKVLLKKLTTIAFPLTPADIGWERMFANLLGLNRRLRSAPPRASRLARWIGTQRRLAARGTLPIDREKRLKESGLV